MMSGMALIWLIFIIVVVTKSKGSWQRGRVWSAPLPPEPAKTADELARDRYARGEIDWPEYQEYLVNLLKDRYVRGELELDEYEQRASLVLDGVHPSRGSASVELPPASVGVEPLPAAPEADVDTRPAAGETAQATDPAPEAGATASTATPEAPVNTALDDLRRRFLTGGLTYQEYEEERRRLLAA